MTERPTRCGRSDRKDAQEHPKRETAGEIRFSGMEDALSLDGDVRTTMVGADYSRGALTLGLSVGRTLGLGGYGGPSGGLAFTDAVTGLSLDVRVRTLVVH